MQKPTFLLSALTVAMCMMLGTNVSVAAEQTQAQKSETVYGSRLMTREERAEYRAKMRSLKTKEEREAFRMEHHQKMQERAKSMGKTLPDMPPAQGSGMMMKPCSGAGPCGGGGMRQQGGGAASGGGY
ncbi:MAG TPA: hypothetical protein VFQ98_00540 [Gallionella sp.]|nr:hypothetical protein [Gallionella sp.]